MISPLKDHVSGFYQLSLVNARIYQTSRFDRNINPSLLRQPYDEITLNGSEWWEKKKRSGVDTFALFLNINPMGHLSHDTISEHWAFETVALEIIRVPSVNRYKNLEATSNRIVKEKNSKFLSKIILSVKIYISKVITIIHAILHDLILKYFF